MEVWQLVAFSVGVVMLNFSVGKALLSCRTWCHILMMLCLAIMFPLTLVLIIKVMFPEPGLPLALLFLIAMYSILGMILLFFMQVFVHTMMRKKKAEVLGYEIEPNQGFAKDFLMQIPKMRFFIIAISVMLTIFEWLMILAGDHHTPFELS